MAIPITNYEDVLKSLVKKYNKGVWDEDLMQEAWLTAILCQKLSDPNLTEEELKARIIVWVRNKLIDIQTRSKFEYCEYSEELEDTRNYEGLIFEVENSLSSERDLKVFNLLLDGKTPKEIQKELNISKSTVYRILEKIKGIIKG